MNHKVLVLIGSVSDASVMRKACEILEDFGIDAELRVSSAHRALDRTIALAREAEGSGVSVIIAGAGLAAHLPGVVAASTTVPVIGVPIQSGPLQGQDALYSIAQMPAGVPVATVGIGNASNAALLAIQILAVGDSDLKARLVGHRHQLEAGVMGADHGIAQTTLKEDTHAARA